MYQQPTCGLLRSMRRALPALAVLVLLAGCGGGSSSGYDTPQAVADAAGCTGVKPVDPELYAADAVSCRFRGHYTQVQWFKDAASLSSWSDMGDALGGGSIVQGSNWVIECDRKPDCDAMQKKAGGEVR